ncbi:MAG: hypothetical protein IT462_12290 [Planctomycetes bacterium]|nr:hypothetical protein [Planctomycetota bacterium]
MQRLMFTLGMLSLLTLALAAGALVYVTLNAPDDAGFLRDYTSRYTPQERKTVRNIAATLAQAGTLTDDALKDYLVDAELNLRLDVVKDSPAFEEILLRDVAQRRNARERRMEAEQESLDRIAARRSAYDAERTKSGEEAAAAASAKARYEKELAEWNTKEKDTRLKQLVSDIDASREPELLLPQLQYLPLSDLYFALTRARNKDNRAAIFNLLPAETQRGLSMIGSNPAGIK